MNIIIARLFLKEFSVLLITFGVAIAAVALASRDLESVRGVDCDQMPETSAARSSTLV